MNALPTLQKQLNSFVRGSATDAERLRDIFQAKTELAAGFSDHSRIRVPREVYDAYWDMHEKALVLIESIEHTLSDPEHQIIIDEAAAAGYRLPDIAAFEYELKDFLSAQQEFDCYQMKVLDDDYVEIPIHVARTLNSLASYNCFMVARIFDGVFNTDYLKHFSDLKLKGFQYAGETALQETLDLLVAMARIANETENQIERGRQSHYCPSLVA